MRYCSTWLRSLLCYIKNFVIDEFFIRVLHCITVRIQSLDDTVCMYACICMLKHTSARYFVYMHACICLHVGGY